MKNIEGFNRITTVIMNWGLCLTVFAVPLFFDWFQRSYAVFDLNKSVLFRLLLDIVCILWLISTALIGHFSLPRVKKILYSLIILVLTFGISTFFSEYISTSLWGTYERQQGLYNIIHYLVLFFLILALLKTREDIKRFLWALIISASLISAYGLLQFFNYDFLRWSEDMGRIFGSFGQPNFFGHYLSVLFPLTLYAAFFLVKRWWGRLLLFLLAVAELICLYGTYSRSAWIAILVVGFIAMVWFCVHFKKTWLALLMSAAAIALIVAMAIPSARIAVLDRLADYNVRGLQRFATTFDASSGTTKIRLIYWKSAWSAFERAPLERKLIGYGPDNLTGVFVSYYYPEMAYYEQINSFPDRAHNSLLDDLLQFGVVGLLTLSSLIGFIMFRLLRYIRSSEIASDRYLAFSLATALAIYFLNNLFSFSLTSLNVVLWSLLGLSVVLTTPERVTIRLGFFQPLSRYILAVAGIVFLSLLWYSFSFRALVADTYYMKVKKAEARLNCREVVDNMEKVLDWYWPSSFYQRIYLFHNINCFSAASTDESRQAFADNLISQANRLSVKPDFYTKTDLAHTYSILGYYISRDYYIQASSYYEELIATNPSFTGPYQDYGRLRLWQAKFSEALEIFNRGLSVIPDPEKSPDEYRRTVLNNQKATFYDLIGLVYYEQAKFNEAKEWYEKALESNPKQFSSLEKLARIYRELGDNKMALMYARRAAVLDPENEAIKILIDALR